MTGSKKGTYFDALKEKHGIEESSAGPVTAEETTPAESSKPLKSASNARIRHRIRLSILLIAGFAAIIFSYLITNQRDPITPPPDPAQQAAGEPASESSEMLRPVEVAKTRTALAEGVNVPQIIEIDEFDLALIPEPETVATDLLGASGDSGEVANAESPVVTNAAEGAELDDLEPEATEPVGELALETDPSPTKLETTPEKISEAISKASRETASELETSKRLDPPSIPLLEAPLEPVVEPARRVSGEQPRYPPSALAAGIGGIVAVEVEVDSTGRVTATRIIERQHPALDRAAEEAVATWRFEPARRNGQPEADTYRARIRFAPPESYQPAVRVLTPLPAYPQTAFVAGTEGIVTLRATIDTNGDVIDVEILEGLPYGLSEAAVEAVKEWKFRPALSDGVPTISQETLRIRFGR